MLNVVAGGCTVGKPVIIKELGMQPTANRLPFYDEMYEVAYSQIQNGSSSAAGGLRVSEEASLPPLDD